MNERAEPRADSTPEGEGFLKAYVPPERSYLVEGAFVRSVIHPGSGRGLVCIDMQGHWNHGESEALTAFVDREVAAEWARFMLDAVAAAGEDEAVYRVIGPENLSSPEQD